MAPIKTYQSSKNTSKLPDRTINKITKKKGKKKKKITIKELPERTENLLGDDSLQVTLNDTFDRICKQIRPDYKPVEQRPITEVAKFNLSDSESSMYRSPIFTRSKTKKKQILSPNPKSLDIQVDSSLIAPTLLQPKRLGRDIVNSLIYENAKSNLSSLGLVLPKNKKVQLSHHSHSISSDSSQLELSNRPLFTQTFREKQAVHSSTPAINSTQPKIMIDVVSPISKASFVEKINNSSNKNKSFTPKTSVIRKTRRISGQLNPININKTLIDKKLNQIVKVIIEPLEYQKPRNQRSSDAFLGFDLNKENVSISPNSFKLLYESNGKLATNTKSTVCSSDSDSVLLIDINETIGESKHKDLTDFCITNLPVETSILKRRKSARLSAIETIDLCDSTIVDNSIEISFTEPCNTPMDEFKKPKLPIWSTQCDQQINKLNNEDRFTLLPGKNYRRSLLHTSVIHPCPLGCDCLGCYKNTKDENSKVLRRSQIIPIDKFPTKLSILSIYAKKLSISGYVLPESDCIKSELDDSLRNLSLNHTKNATLSIQDPTTATSFIDVNSLAVFTAKDIVLRRCLQTEPLQFEECYTKSFLKNCQKIGEGVYGEVFLCKNPKGGTSVMKVIPIEGTQIVNGEHQKKFDEILSEIVIAMELSHLRNNIENKTNSFNEVQNVRCVKGRYPERLIDLWDLFAETRGTENDSPEMFTDEQLYIILELDNGGLDLEAFIFNNAVQSFSMFKQVACALAVAELQLKFEHRDLHWGNILIKSMAKTTDSFEYLIDGKKIFVPSQGVQVSIIDYTLSRIDFDDVIIFNDLSLDKDMFKGQGDYQFEIYRLMQNSNGNNWQSFNPYTNILWLHYILDKAVKNLRYKYCKTNIHKQYITKLETFKEEILSFDSVSAFVLSRF